MTTVTIALCEMFKKRKIALLPSSGLSVRDREFERVVIGFVYSDEDDAGSVRKTRHGEEIVASICGDNPKPDAFLRPGRPSEKTARWFDVIIKIDYMRGNLAQYECDYHRHDGCPVEASSQGMEIYHTVRSLLRKKRKQYEADVKAKREAIKK